MNAATLLATHFGNTEFSNFNVFVKELKMVIKMLGLKLSISDKKQIINCMSWRTEDASKVTKKQDKDGTVHFKPDIDLREIHMVPLLENIDDYFKWEVIPHVPDAWINHDKNVIGYEIPFAKYFSK